MQGEILSEETPEQIYARVFRELKPRTPPPAIAVEFRRFANVQSFIHWKESRLEVRISDILASAPAPVQEALAWILLCKMFRKPVPPRHLDRYKRYLNRREVVRTAELLRKERGRKRLLPPQGRCRNLVTIFEDLNLLFFHGLMARPNIGWSPTESRSLLGHYDSAHHAIVISRLLDREEVPLYVVEYVMYHEMLHLRFPVERRGSRRCIHTPEFKKAEECFPRFADANQWLQMQFHRLRKSAPG